MNEKDKEEAINRYSSRLEKYGYSPLTLGWGAKGRASLRFEIFTQAFDFSGATILDFGCGFGDFFGFLNKKNIRFKKYIGVDINPDLISKAKEIYPDADFICCDLLSESLDINNEVDYVVSSGVFNHKISDSYSFIRNCFSLFDQMAVCGFCCNFLSDKVDPEYISDALQYNSPGKVITLAYEVCNNVVLRNDYMPYEFTVTVNKSAKVNQQLTVYEKYEKYV